MGTLITPRPTMFDDLDVVDLDTLNAAASLQERVDRKYILDSTQLAQMLEGLGGGLSVLQIDGERRFGYESVYFDTPDLESYRAAAQKRRLRYKVRTRTYLDTETSMLEVKTRGRRGLTVKRRQPHGFGAQAVLDSEAREFVDTVSGRPGLGARLSPVLTTRYLRTTLVDLDTPARITIDSDLRCSDSSGDTLRLDNRSVVETKSAGSPSPADRWLWANGIRPEKISKFGTGLAALHPELPSNKWHRTINRHFAAA